MVELTPVAWALLDMLSRGNSGERPLPTGCTVDYALLMVKGLATFNGDGPAITEAGRVALGEYSRLGMTPAVPDSPFQRSSH